MTALSILDYWIIGTFLGVIFCVGIMASWLAARSMEHYFFGGRNLPWYFLGISGMSGWFDLTGTMISSRHFSICWARVVCISNFGEVRF